MAKSKATIYDIAAELEITPSTVSRALSDHPRISVKTKEKVRRVATQLNYQHNGIAAALRSGNTFIIGVMIPTADRSFFASVLRGIEQVAQEAGYNVMITQSHDNEENECSNVKALLKAQVDGVIASIARETQSHGHFRELIKKGVPLVLFDRVTEISGASTVVVDDYLGAFRATEHLIEQGYRRIAHFGGKQHINIYKYRHRGYRDALEKHKLAYRDEWVDFSALQIEDGEAATERLLALAQRPDAIFAASDYAALGALKVFKQTELEIPRDVGLVGFANEPFCSFIEPALSSVNQLSPQM